MAFTAAVVGLGQIGQGYDYDATDDRLVLTHATAFHHHPKFSLIAGVDPNARARSRFADKFKVPAFATLADLVESQSPDVISIGVPTAWHSRVFHEALGRAPQVRAILCEKPLASSHLDAMAMVEATLARRCTLLVNFMRRFEPGVLELKRRIDSDEYGEVYKATVWYSGGFLNSASHFVDLALFLLGPAGEIIVLSNDESPDVRISFGSTTVDFIAVRDHTYSLNEMIFIAERGCVRYLDGGAEILSQEAVADPVFAGYTSLARQSKSIPSQMSRYQWHVAEALFQQLENGVPLNSSGESALETQAVVERVMTLGDARAR